MPQKRKSEEETKVNGSNGSVSNNEEGVAEKKKKLETTESMGKNTKPWNFKIISWNISGVRAWIKKDGLSIFDREDPDIVCLQEMKCSNSKLPQEFQNLKHKYFAYNFPAKKEGYSGVSLVSKKKPLSVKMGIGASEHDDEGRSITAEYEQFYLVNAYVPNSGKKLITLDKRLDWEAKFVEYLKDLDKKKPVIYCGDLNVAHNEIDLANPKSNVRNAGFTVEERGAFTNLLGQGFVDTFRHLYPDLKHQYTFWTYMMNARAKNVGWRLDYFVLSSRLVERMSDNVILSSVMGSDHCPISLLVDLAEKA